MSADADSETSSAFWIVEPGRGEIRTEPIRPPAGGEVQVRALYSGISRGTEALVFAGRVPPSEYERMRAPFQDGNFPAPLKYGYASVGVVEKVGGVEEVGGVEAGPAELRGRTVFVLYPHQTRYVVPAAWAHPLPDGVPPGRAVLAANLETAINGIWDARPQVGDRIAVVGAGTVGSLVAWLASRIPGCSVELIDINPARSSIAAALGVSFASPSTATGDADVVIHASASQDGLDLALRLAAFEATVVELSWYGDRQVAVPLGEAFHVRRLTLKSSQVGAVADSQRARWTTERRMQLALTLLAEPALDALITGESAFTALPEVMARLAREPGDTLCHRIRYSR